MKKSRLFPGFCYLINSISSGCDIRHADFPLSIRIGTVIDCHDREVLGYEFALRSRAKEAERAVEAACLQRFGTLRPMGAPVLRSDNGLICQSRRFRQAYRDYRLRQDLLHPTRRNRTESSSGSFAVSKKSVSDNMSFRRLRKLASPFETGCSGTTRNGRIRRWGIGARFNTGHNNQLRWLDFRGALH